MSGVIRKEFRLSVPHGHLDRCIADLEDALGALRRTPYHALIGLDFLHHTKAASRYLTER